MNWYLKKEFFDPFEGITDVVIHYSFSPLGTPANWAANADSRSMPAGQPLRTGVGEVAKYGPAAPRTPQVTHPRLRKKVISMPVELQDPRTGVWSTDYNLHYFYEIIVGWQRHFTPFVTEEIRLREIVLVDALGILGGACTNWSVYDWDAPQFSPMEDPRVIAYFGEDHPLRQPKFYGAPNQEAFGVAKKALIDTLPLPHTFVARVQAPVGSTVRLRFHAGDWGLPEHRRWEVYMLLNESFVMTPFAAPLVYAPFGTQAVPAPLSRVTPELLFGNPYAPLIPGYQPPVIAPFTPAPAYYPAAAPLYPTPAFTSAGNGYRPLVGV